VTGWKKVGEKWVREGELGGTRSILTDRDDLLVGGRRGKRLQIEEKCLRENLRELRKVQKPYGNAWVFNLKGEQ